MLQYMLLMAVPWMAALLPLFLSRFAKWLVVVTSGAVASLCVIFSLQLLLRLKREGAFESGWEIFPERFFSFAVLVDGLSVFYGLLVSVIGLAVVAFSWEYFHEKAENLARFLALIFLFSGAMYGTVFSANLIQMFIFWELTGLVSFLLIGFDHRNSQALRGARMAFLITSMTGLVMLAGVVLLVHIGGTADIVSLYGMRDKLSQHPFFTPAAVFMLVGAFGKSAQIPLFFWLPNAMSAPTPASAYLHSATMVKLGLFLVARMFPLFRDELVWSQLLILSGFGSFILCTALAVLSHDLKAIFAYTTVAQLGIILCYYGLPTELGVVQHDLWHIVAHALYKAPLFMMAGLVDHARGSRDVRRLGRLAKTMPWLALATTASLVSFLGFPATPGAVSKAFIAKSLDASASIHSLLPSALALLSYVASFLSGMIAARVLSIFFTGRRESEVGPDMGGGSRTHGVSLRESLAPLCLAAASLAMGLFPGAAGQLLAGFSVPLIHAERFTKPYMLLGGVWKAASTLGLVGLGALMALVLPRFFGRLQIPRVLRFDRGFDHMIELVYGAGRDLRWRFGSGNVHEYLHIVVGFSATLFVLSLVPSISGLLGAEAIEFDVRSYLTISRLGASVLICALLAITILAMHRLQRIIAVNLLGLIVAVFYVFYRAPDVALTQFLVDIATAVLLLLLFAGIPSDTEMSERPGRVRNVVAVVVSVGFGLSFALFSLIGAKPRPVGAEPIGSRFLELSASLAKGNNVVNTILVDFRALDTFFEVTVLVIAMFGCTTLLMREKTRDKEDR